MAARHATGDEWAAYADAPPYNVLKIPGTSVSTVGLTAPGDGDDAGDGFEEVTLLDRRMGYYKKCVVRHDRLVGAVLIGDNAEFAAFRRLIETGSELDEQREQLLRPAAAGLPGSPRGRRVCSCHGVGADDLSAAVAAGSATLDELCAATRAGTGCGTCRPEVAAFLADSAGTPLPGMEPSAGAGAAAPESSEPMAAAVNPTAALPALIGPSESAGAAAPESSEPMAAAVNPTAALPALIGPSESAGAAAPEPCEPMASDVTSAAALSARAGPPGSAGAAAPESADSSCTAPAATAEAVSTLEEQPRGEPAERPEAALV